MFANTGNFNIVELKLQETGTFDTQYIRPYSAVVRHDAVENFATRINQTIGQNTVGRVDSSLVSGMSDGLITLSATPERPVGIVNGWGERRFRFILTVSVSNGFGEEIYYFQGYSEFFSVSHGGHIDPKMVFYINSYTRVNRVADPTNPNGGYIDRVTESKQVLNGRYAADNMNEIWGIRPEDLFVGLQSSYISGGIDYLGGSPIKDTRIGFINDTFASTRNNAIPSQMLSKIVNTYRNVQTLADFGQGGENIYDRAIQMVHENSPLENVFIRRLSEIQGTNRATVFFTLNDLQRMDPTIQSRVFYQPLANPGMVHTAGSTQAWNGTDIETQTAALVSSTVVPLMQECGLITSHFYATNQTIGSIVDARMTAPGVTIATSNPEGAYSLFLARFTTEVMPDITKNNMIGVMLNVSADVYNETHISISIEGHPVVDYVFPSFSDSLLQPTISTDQNNYNGMITGVEFILNHCGIDGGSSIGYPSTSIMQV